MMIVPCPRWLLISLAFVWLTSVGMSSCEPAWQRSLRITPPKGSPEKRIQWFRKTFYRLAQEERRANDGGDRLRHMVRKWPLLTQTTYKANQAWLILRRKEGLPFEKLDQFYLTMNAFIRMALPTISFPPLRLNRPEAPQDNKTRDKGS